MDQSVRDIEMAKKVAELVCQAGGRAYYVGGFVRDALLNIHNKDIDIEVHGISHEDLEKILDSLGERITIGESFGVFNLKGYSLDIAMPRKEEARGQGHRDFAIFVNPFIGTEAAARRRDFTVNSLMQDVLTGEIIDHFGGLEDLNKGILCHVNDASFPEDPLRVLRGAQFAARFRLKVAEETLQLCRSMDLTHLPGERIEGELKKALLKAERPSLFFEILRQMEQLDVWFPELKALIGVGQHAVYHAEGDVWNHTMMVLDEAAKLRHRADNPYWFMLSALVHDFGKAVATAEKDGRKLLILTYGAATENDRYARVRDIFEYVFSNPSPVKTSLMGDVNADGQISAADARLVLRASVGLEASTPLMLEKGDVDKNGSLTAADARLVLRASVGLETIN